jgi:hypothetical protein
MDSFDSLLKQIKQIQTIFYCNNCKQYYSKKWCNNNYTICFYCTNFIPYRDNRYHMLRDTEWYFIKSGQDNRNEFYNEYIDNLNKWCIYFKIPYSKNDLLMEKELRNIDCE